MYCVCPTKTGENTSALQNQRRTVKGVESENGGSKWFNQKQGDRDGGAGTTDAMLNNLCCSACEAACSSSGQQDAVQMLLYDWPRSLPPSAVNKQTGRRAGSAQMYSHRRWHTIENDLISCWCADMTKKMHLNINPEKINWRKLWEKKNEKALFCIQIKPCVDPDILYAVT